MSPPVRARRSALLPSLVVGVGLAAAVALAGWLLLLFVKGAVVLLGYALGVALIVVPLLMARRIVAGRSGRERWRRVGTITEVVALGVALCVVAHLLGQHGWLLIALPAAAVLLARVARAAKPVGAAPPR